MFVNFNILNQLGSPAINSNTFANRPAAGQTGRLFVSTDTFEIYRDNGTTWDLIGGPGSSTITGTGTATQVAYFTSSQAIGSSANLFWDNTNGFLGVATAVPTARIEAVKTDGYGIYANYTTNAGSGSSATAIYAINNTASSGYAAVIEERTGNTTGGQYPLLVKHSLSSGTAAVGNGTGLQFQLQDDAGTFKTTQLTIETTDAAAATYKSRYRFNVQNNGSSTPVAYINATGLGLFTATPGAALDIHSTGIMAQLNSTSATANSLLAFQRSGSGLWRIGDNYNSGTNFFELYNTALSTNAIAVLAATNKTEFTAVETYSTGLARANYFDYNLSVAAGGSFSSPNAITALGASLDLTLAGNATIPSGARTGLDAYNTVSFTGAGTLTMSQGTQIRPYSNVTAGWAFNGSATGTITHLAGLRVLFTDNTGSAVSVTNNYGLLINDQTANTGTVTFTNRWGIYQEGASDLNYFAANTLIGLTTNNGSKLSVNGNVYVSQNIGVGAVNNAWNNAIFNVIESGTGAGTAYFSGRSDGVNSLRIGINHYYDSFFKYTANGYATALRSANGEFNFYTAPTGLANNPVTFTHTFGINANGNATISDSAIYDAVGSTISLTIDKSGGNGQLTLAANGTALGRLFADFSSGELRIGNPTSNPLTLFTANTERGRITANGNFGFNTSTPNAIGGYTIYTFNTEATRTTGSIIDINISGSRKATFYATANDVLFGSTDNIPLEIFTNGTERCRLTAGGNFLIGTTTDAGQKLQVNGTTRSEQVQNADGTVNMASNVATTIYTPSGARGLFIIYVSLPNGDGSPNNYSAYAIVSWDTLSARILQQTDASNLFITLNGNNIQARQTSGNANDVTYRSLKIG